MLIKILKLFFVLLIWAAIAASVVIVYFINDLPDIKKLATIEKNRKISIIDKNNEVLHHYGDLYGNFVQYNHIPKHLIQALLSTEDRRFFSHHGFDFIGVMRAAFANLRAGKVVQGGSTITQQLAKIVFLTPERNLKRKIEELVLSFYIEYNLSKQQILTIYLNRVYLGSGIYGIDAAAKYYFGKELKELNLTETAIIVGLLKAPNRYSPAYHAEKSGERAYQILLNMLDAGYITMEQLNEANSEPVVVESGRLGYLNHSYFTSWVVDAVNLMIPDNGEDLVVKTTLDRHLQSLAEKALTKIMSTTGHKKAGQAALVSLTPKGEILAMVGGVDFSKSSFNRVTQALRQPGSAFKHAIYLAGFENGFTPDDEMVDEPIAIGKWKPRNTTRKHYGVVTLRNAFAKSLNTIPVKISEEIGRDKVIDTARRLGITAEMHPYPSLALGVFEITLLELTGSYATIANNGCLSTPYGIEYITDSTGALVYKRADYHEEKVIEDEPLHHIYDALIAVVESDIGTGKGARLAGRQVAAKTGTSQNYRDAWFLGFTSDIVTGVWVGNDDDSATGVKGGATIPAQIWREFMNPATANLPSKPILE